MAADSQIWNVPNRISMARLILACAVFVLIPMQLYWLAFVIFLIAAGTDWVDGWYARKYDQVTQLGRILDPFCDKILICGLFILLAVRNGWAVSVVRNDRRLDGGCRDWPRVVGYRFTQFD